MAQRTVIALPLVNDALASLIQSPKRSGVEYVRDDVLAMLPVYEKIRDCLLGQEIVKSKGERYLRRPNPEDDKSGQRFIDYMKCAIFYNVTKNTSAGMIGQIFLREPVVTIPPALDTMALDITGSGISLTQCAKQVTAAILNYGRAGLFTDYPNTGGKATTQAELLAGNIRPTITAFEPWKIINWRTMARGAKTLLSLVVLRDYFPVEDDGFEYKTELLYKVLRLDENGFYEIQIWQPVAIPGKGTQVELVELIQPLDKSGNRIDEIPFTFVGAADNSSDIDQPPMNDIADLNLGHYQNSADYEESCFLSGQPTVVVTGLTQQWVVEVLKGKVMIGARGGIPLPAGAAASMLQSNPNSQPFEAMQHKERQMVALGAKLVEQTTVQRTATETNLDASAEGSTLGNISNNASAAIQWSLEWCAFFLGIGGPEGQTAGISFELNDEFDLAVLTPDERRQVIAEWQADAITWGEMRRQLKLAGSATEDDKKAKQEIDQAAQESFDMEAARAKTLGQALGDDTQSGGDDGG